MFHNFLTELPLNFSLPSAESIGNENFTLRNFSLREKPPSRAFLVLPTPLHS